MEKDHYDWKTDKRIWKKTTRMHVDNHDYYSIDANINAVIAESFLKHMDIWFDHYYPNAAYWLNYLIDEMAFCARNPNVEYIKKKNKVKKEHMKLCKQWIPDAKGIC